MSSRQGLMLKPRMAFVVLGICFALSMLGRSANEIFPVFLLPISAEFGWDRAEVVSIYSLAALSAGLASPLVGRLFDLLGPRAVYAFGLLLVGGGFSAAAYAQALWQLQLCVGLAAGFGAACLGTVASSLLLGRWFGPRLPMAMAVVFAATGIGTLIGLPLSQVLIDAYGWRGAYRLIGVVMLGLAVPLLVLPWRRLAAGASGAIAAPSDQAGAEWKLSSAMCHHAFWALFSTYFFTGVGMYCIAAQVVAYLVEAGFPPLQAATAWGFSGVALAAGMVSVSLLDGLLGRRRAILFAYGLSVTGIIMLWLLRAYPSIWLLAGFIICFGSTIGSRGPLISATAMTIFRGERVGTIFGAISLGSGLGAAFGSWSGGLIHDWTGNYDLMIVFALVNLLLGMMPFLVVPSLRQ
ncbi:MFS transporter [Bradyrhizobium sp. LHD-71]|uniref:MFS transporter n=1 Tax=Bradyrhizobium sp. LHD-71 TaxID=3072141 RepID=UPI00280E82F1|nr:MFS transporter [Bradyrhizobium sp. LHD-71]MDQ8726492.1 MFS transporter [Bradyrhizobium sp. LHD-71]